MRIDRSRIEIMLAERGMTQQNLAEKSGVSRQGVNVAIRRGTCAPKTVGKLASGLGVSVSDIIAKEG